MKHAALYPYNASLLPFIRHFHTFQSEYHLIALISPPGLSLAHKDAAHACNQPPIGISVKTDICDEIDLWDSLIVIYEPKIYSLHPDEYVTTIIQAVHKGKEILLLFDESEEIPERIRELLTSKPQYIRTLPTPPVPYSGGRFNSFSVPIIYVGGLIEEADVSEVTLSLAEQCILSGLRPTVFSKRCYAPFFSMFSLSPPLFSGVLPISERITHMSDYIANISFLERPDVIIIEAPDAVLKYSDLVPNGYGIYSYLICQSVQPDYFICCLPCDLSIPEYINALSQEFMLRFRTPISAVHASNALIDGATIASQQKMSVIYSKYSHNIPTNPLSVIPVFNVIDDNASSLYSFITTS